MDSSRTDSASPWRRKSDSVSASRSALQTEWRALSMRQKVLLQRPSFRRLLWAEL
jgi:hypothetical protein